MIGEQLGYYLQENSEMSQMLVRKAIKAREARKLLGKHEKKAAVGKTQKGESLLSGKLTPAQSRNPKK